MSIAHELEFYTLTLAGIGLSTTAGYLYANGAIFPKALSFLLAGFCILCFRDYAFFNQKTFRTTTPEEEE